MPLSLRLLFILFFSVAGAELPARLRGIRINCGATSVVDDGGDLPWLPDGSFNNYGVAVNLDIAGLVPTLSTLRSFPLPSAPPPRPIRFCYALPVYRGARYLLRTTHFYGGWGGPPPVFDLIVDGTFWTVVNTTADRARMAASYYEAVFMGVGKTMRVCVGANTYTDSSPFISALELILLQDSVYNATDFHKNAMALIARSNFGSNGPMVRFPDDRFDRYWQPYSGGTHAANSNLNISASGFWNLPPANVLKTALIADQNEPLDLQWPPLLLPNSSYYIALYFADILDGSSRKCDVFINGNSFFKDLQITSFGVAVFASPWILSGSTKITFIPRSTLPPLINAGEVFGIFPLGRNTSTRDVTALENIKSSINNPPLDWNGDPCLPREYSWSGVTCSEGTKIRVVTLNLSSMGLSGFLSPSISNLTALTVISFANNNLTGHIPDLSRLRGLSRLDLQNNQLTGNIPPSLGNMKNLQQLFLQNNNLTGNIPHNLRTKPGLNLKVLPGNQLESNIS